MKRVFIGGSNDGERLDDFGGRQTVVALKKPDHDQYAYRGDINDVPMMEEEEYRRELISGDKETFVVYVERSMHIDDALSRLITGYKSNTKGEEPL